MVLKQIFTISSQKDSKPIDAPLNKGLMIVPKNNAVWFLLEKETVVEQEASKNAFTFLMQNSKKRKKLEKKRSVVTSKWKLYNDVLDLCDVNFRQAEFSNAQKLLKCLVDVLWHKDGNHEHINNKFAEKQCKGLPTYFNPVYSHTYNDYKALKKAKPKL